MNTAEQIATTEPAPDRMSLAVAGLEPESAITIRGAFETMFAQADEWASRARAIKVTSVDDKRGMKFARESRLALREIRVNAEHARKRLKEDSTRRGKAIDGIANVLKALIEPIEEHLLEQESFADRAEAARRSALSSARAESLVAYGADPSVYTNLGALSEETWASTLDAAKVAHEARLEAAKQAEEVRLEAERIAAERRETAKKEAARVEAERIERERLQLEENARLKAEGDAIREQARIEAEKVAAAITAERAEMKAAADARAAELEAVRLEREAERIEKERAEAARLAAELAPDRDKLTAFAATLRALTIPTLTTESGKAAAVKVAEQIEKMAAWVTKTGAAL